MRIFGSRRMVGGTVSRQTLNRIREELVGHAATTGPADRPAVEAAIGELYELGRLGRGARRLRRPRFVWVDSPWAARRLLSERPRSLVRKDDLLGWGMFEAPDAGLSAGDPAFLMVCGRVDWLFTCTPGVVPWLERRLELWTTLMRSAGWWWPGEEECVVSERATHVVLEPDENGGKRLHFDDGPAVRYRDGATVYAWHGVVVPERIVQGRLTAADWRAERNSDRRRAMADRMGDAWLIDSGVAHRVADDEHGTLWRVPNGELDDDERLAVCLIPSGWIAPEDWPDDILLVEMRQRATGARSVLRYMKTL